MFNLKHVVAHLKQLGVPDEVVKAAQGGRRDKIDWAALLKQFGPLVIQLLLSLLPK